MIKETSTATIAVYGTKKALIGEPNQKSLLVIAKKALIGTVL